MKLVENKQLVSFEKQLLTLTFDILSCILVPSQVIHNDVIHQKHESKSFNNKDLH